MSVAMRSYTSPFFGDRDTGDYRWNALDYDQFLPIRNRPESKKVMDDGRVYSGDIFTNVTGINRGEWSYGVQGAISTCYNVATAQEFLGKSDSPACIFAFPRFFGTSNVSYAEWYKSTVETLGDMPTFDYYLVSLNKGASFGFEFPNPVGGASTSYWVEMHASTSDTWHSDKDMYVPWYPSLTRASSPDAGIPFVRDNTAVLGRKFSNLPIYIQNERYGARLGQLDGYPFYDTSDLTRMISLMGVWTAQPDSVINDVYYITIGDGAITNSNFLPGYNTNRVGAFIATQLPIFTLDSFDQMVNYFQGKSWVSENDDLPEDWSTDWDIYIKGAQRPEIFITMKSSKLDEWLESKDNTSGLNKGDIKVEYRYELAGTVGGNDINAGDIVDWVTDSYDDTRATDYMSNIALNYAGADLTNGTNEFNDYTIDQLIKYYATMQFRLHYGTNASAWCRYRIGVIGSPSLPDFTLMNNVGVQDDEDIVDDSTVTLHYDEYPPDYDPYPTPPNPPMPPPPDDTNPVPIPAGQNGIGLLTTTYKVTVAQVEALGRFFWGGDFFQKLIALNTSPIENVVGLTVMPINISGTTSVIVVGNVDTNINGDEISTVPIYDLGSVKIDGRYGNFLDYAPYTTIQIFLPFVGFVPLDPVYVTGKTLSVKYSYDVINGLCNAMLFVDGVYMESHQGNCGVNIPLIASNRNELGVGLATSIFSTAMGAQEPLQLMGDIGQYITGQHSTRQGGYSPTLAWNETRNCFLVIETPNASYSGTYKHDKGLPCNASHTIGSLTGFTVCSSDIDVSGISGATEEEKVMIKDMLTTGVYL